MSMRLLFPLDILGYIEIRSVKENYCFGPTEISLCAVP